MAIKTACFTFNHIQENTYVIWDESLRCVIIDPGCYENLEKNEIISFIAEHKLQPELLLNTHCHIDHILGNNFIKTTYKIPLLIHSLESEILRMGKVFAPMYGFPKYEESEADKFISEQDIIKFGNTEMSILFLPGHSPGHLAFVHQESKSIFSGDVLFFRSIGRTDLPGGHHQTLLNSIQNNLFSLSDDYIVYPGHGKPTKLGEEKKLNPYLN